VRVLPARAIAVVAPLSTLLVRAAGTKFTVGAGLLTVVGGRGSYRRPPRPSTLVPYHVPHAVMQATLGSVGAALEVASRVGGVLGSQLGHLAHSTLPAGRT